MQETWVQSLGWEDPLEKGKAPHSSIMAWRIPWTVYFMGVQRVRHGWVTFTSLTYQAMLSVWSVFGYVLGGPPWWLRAKRVCLQCRRPGWVSGIRKIPWRREWRPTPVFLPGEPHGQRSLVGYRPVQFIQFSRSVMSDVHKSPRVRHNWTTNRSVCMYLPSNLQCQNTPWFYCSHGNNWITWHISSLLFFRFGNFGKDSINSGFFY